MTEQYIMHVNSYFTNYQRQSIVNTANQLIFAAINFCGFVVLGIFVTIYFFGTEELDYSRTM